MTKTSARSHLTRRISSVVLNLCCSSFNFRSFFVRRSIAGRTLCQVEPVQRQQLVEVLLVGYRGLRVDQLKAPVLIADTSLMVIKDDTLVKY